MIEWFGNYYNDGDGGFSQVNNTTIVAFENSNLQNSKMSEKERKEAEAKAILNILQQGEKEDLKNNRLRYVVPNYSGKDW